MISVCVSVFMNLDPSVSLSRHIDRYLNYLSICRGCVEESSNDKTDGIKC